MRPSSANGTPDGLAEHGGACYFMADGLVRDSEPDSEKHDADGLAAASPCRFAICHSCPHDGLVNDRFVCISDAEPVPPADDPYALQSGECTVLELLKRNVPSVFS